MKPTIGKQILRNSRISDCLDLVKDAHGNQVRLSGDPYWTHSYQVMLITAVITPQNLLDKGCLCGSPRQQSCQPITTITKGGKNYGHQIAIAKWLFGEGICA